MTTGKVAAIAKSMLGSGVGSAVADYIDEHPDIFTDYAKVDGSYSSLTAGNAEQLVSTVGVNDKTPYLFRTTGGSADVGDRVKLSEITGGTVAWNQLLKEMDSTNFNKSSSNASTVSITDGVATVTASQQYAGIINSGANRPPIPTGHKVLCSVDVKLSSAVSNAVKAYWNERNSNAKTASANTSWQTLASIISWDSTKLSTARVHDYRASDWDSYQVKNSVMFDLTAMFGSTIADYIYSLEQNTTGAGVAWFRKLFPKDYYAYDAGTLLSVKTSAHKTIGFNAYDNTTGKAKVVGGQVYQITGTYTALSLDGTSITPDASGYFTPAASGELTVTGGNATDTCIHLKWDGERDGEYEPYVEYNYLLDSDLELRGIPKLDASNNLYYDGDSYAPDGTVTRKYGYRAYEAGDATDGSTMITDGTNTVYKLTTPTTESADPFTETQVCNDFGTEEFVDSRTVPMPVGANAIYQANIRAKLEMAPDSPDGDGDYIVRQTDGLNEYVAVSSNSTISGLSTRCPDCPTDTDGTFVLKATVSSGAVTYAWTAES